MLRDQRHARLLTAARAGDSRAFRQLYREIFDPVARYLSVRVRKPEEAEDLTSQAIHRFLERLEDYRPSRGSVLAWVLTMAHSILVDHYRAQRPTLSLDQLSEVLAGRSDGPLDLILHDERARLVRQLLEELGPETRRMLALRFEQDLGYREIAVCMGLSEDAVKQRFSRTFRQLRSILRERRLEIDHAG